MYIGANSFQNNNAYLEAWVAHAQSLKPGCKMPNIDQYSGAELRGLVAYLRQLQWLVVAGVDLRKVMELAGHQSMTMTLRNLHLAPAHTASTMERIA
jgi:hypothetical protein